MQSSGKKTRDTIYVMLISGALSVGLIMVIVQDRREDARQAAGIEQQAMTAD